MPKCMDMSMPSNGHEKYLNRTYHNQYFICQSVLQVIFLFFLNKKTVPNNFSKEPEI